MRMDERGKVAYESVLNPEKMTVDYMNQATKLFLS